VEDPTTTSEEEGEPVLSKDAVELFWSSRFENAEPGLAGHHRLPTAKFTGDELDEATAAIQEQKAVKADDAAVPRQLWEQHLFDPATSWGSYANEKWKNQQKQFRSACSLSKMSMLGYWKKLVCRSLTNWIKTRHPCLGKTLPSVNTLVQEMPHQG
jgi:hypothetical protein